MKIVFLDFDGVLNHYLMLLHEDRDTRKQFSPPAVERLNTIVKRTGARVVVSSTWREWNTVDRLRTLLAEEGFVGEVLDHTPILHPRTKRFPDPNPGQTRCMEIMQWIDARPERPERFVALDDLDLELLAAYHVKTESDMGLLDEHVELSVDLLGETP
ncbi:HAD domain-containing protein [Polyangium mundeleinium]|uniref:HAD domain-containing protein n=1 Tax=Polyangium mundeleinium TaxID=2995306 RepID=A0ABT5ERX8_9BACT|nr:HAD domain-containing protein [Polyangium mundeleinium]MDC0744568.1 HAD domain-containing protein [Polyangium mundeleinium]